MPHTFMMSRKNQLPFYEQYHGIRGAEKQNGFPKKWSMGRLRCLECVFSILHEHLFWLYVDLRYCVLFIQNKTNMCFSYFLCFRWPELLRLMNWFWFNSIQILKHEIVMRNKQRNNNNIYYRQIVIQISWYQILVAKKMRNKQFNNSEREIRIEFR